MLPCLCVPESAPPVASSLKGYIPALARLLGTTPAALYERQRALVRAGLLASEEGRGPGSGVRTTESSVASLLLSVLSTERLSDAEARTRSIAELQPLGGNYCPYTRRPSFGKALVYILSATGVVAGVDKISVSRTADRARLHYYDNSGDPKVSEFVGPNAAEPAISVIASLNDRALTQIVDDVQAILQESFDQETRPPDQTATAPHAAK